MPITGPASYIPTTQAFLDHWLAVNAALPVDTPLTLPGEPLGQVAVVTRATLDGFYNALDTAHTSVQQKINALEMSRADLVGAQTALLDRLVQFNDKVRGLLPGTRWEAALPLAPSLGDAQSRFVDPLVDASDIWNQINGNAALGAVGDLLLRDNYNRDQFDDDIQALKAAWRGFGGAELQLKLARGARNELQDKIYPILRQYRVVVPTLFAPENALVESLPRLTPAPGRTPAVPVASGIWDAAAVKARITFTAEDAADVDRYELRYSPGVTYSTDDESVVASIPADGTKEFLTNFALGQPGAFALFRVYVVLTTENERGSNTVRIDRPEN